MDTEEFMKHRSITHVEMVIKFGGMAAKNNPMGKNAARAFKKSLKPSSSPP